MLTHYEHSAMIEERTQRARHVEVLNYLERVLKLTCDEIAKHVVHVDSLLTSCDVFAAQHNAHMQRIDDSSCVHYDDAYRAFARASFDLMHALAHEDARARREFVTRKPALTDERMLAIASERAHAIAEAHSMKLAR